MVKMNNNINVGADPYQLHVGANLCVRPRVCPNGVSKKSPLGGLRGLLFLLFLVSFSSCSDWLDVVPDGVATMDMVFKSRPQALKYLGTCYSFMSGDGHQNTDPAVLGGDELWGVINPMATGSLGLNFYGNDMAKGMQNAANPMFARWGYMYQALHDCNAFLDNIGLVPDLPPWEREQWIAEVKVLKAYYHFRLVQMYGPVPLIRENFPMDVDVSKVKVEREPVDDCFRYIVELLDEACTSYALPLEVLNPADELGRITLPIALAIKAKVLVTAASPLFNGNNDQTTLRNRDGKQLFNPTYDPEKWQKAVVACREAIQACHAADIALYEYPNIGNRYTDTIATELSLRHAFTERWNSELIWANTQSLATVNRGGIIFGTIPVLNSQITNYSYTSFWGMPLKIASMFYTHNGVPLEEDKTRDVNSLYDLRTAQGNERLYIRQGRGTVDLHFDREPRFYAWVGFDGGIWFGAGRIDDKNPSALRYLGLKIGEPDGTIGTGVPTGYTPKKHIPVDAQMTAVATFSALSYAWPLIRLSDLYLLYAEAINEAEGPTGANSNEMFRYIDAVRARAGLKGVKESWDTYTNNPKYNNQTGMRQIIQQERLIELSFEGHRFWDVRRWKIAPDLYRTPLESWFMNVSIVDGTEREVNEIMYTPQFLLQQKFGVRDYFWPIRNRDIDINPNLVQNIGW